MNVVHCRGANLPFENSTRRAVTIKTNQLKILDNETRPAKGARYRGLQFAGGALR
jgi:hypothetical protein